MSYVVAPPSYDQSQFETASVRSAAPSYTSAAPTYHSAVDPASRCAVSPRLPPPGPPPHTTLAAFSGNTAWSTVRANPTARQYRAVARRRVRKEETHSGASVRSARRDEDAHRLPGDDTAICRDTPEQARREQEAPWGDEVLVRENERWAWMLDQMKGWDERQNDWTGLRREAETLRRGSLLARILGRK